MSLRTHALPALMLLLGLAIIVRTVAAGGGPTALGILFGALFCAAGGLRLWAETRKPGP
jgi:hypothetical protein